MVRHGSERSLHSPQSMHADYSAHVNNTNESPSMDLESLESATCTDNNSSTLKVNADNSVVYTTGSAPSTVPSPSVSSVSSSLDSRIPRPSPTGLRRSVSMRMRGERVSPNHPPPPPSTAVTAGLSRSYQQCRRFNLLHHQQHHHLDHRTFPVITENGTESPRQRSLSLSLTPARPRPGHAASGGSSTGIADDSDAESVKSYGSACSTASACDHATFALNGTTWSGRSRKYVVHCSNHTGDNEQYLTPTQRAARQVRKFQALLKEARKEIEEKDQEIFRLTKEVVELRLYKASLNSPDERTDSSDALTVRENNPFSPESPSKDLPDEGTLQKVASPETPEKCAPSDLPSSLADSGHFEDGSVHSKDSVYIPEVQPESTHVTATPNTVPENSTSDTFVRSAAEIPERDEVRRKLVNLYESRIEEMHRRHVDELQELKQKHNDKVESLLNQLAEVNTRYCEVRPSVDAAEARARELEAELETVKTELSEQKALLNEQEERNKQMYLRMYAKGQEAARLEQADQIYEHAHQTPPKVTVAELLQQLTITQAELENIKDTSYSPEPHISADRSQSLLSAQEAVSLWVLGTRKAMYRRIIEARNNQGALDPEITLQFLKSAIYYFLTDKENHHGHLNAIESILGFTEVEKHNIDKIYRSIRK
ncbi:uncharacterized protein LOC100749917 isoform X1 [Bombus impatiens]|uniref:Uncharacterized protein LOC100749917 isoform X1 n=1 Tax=Bombus impatiens TaxID=132113 RepID=A0A6P3UV52_BOMIM|nr:uncharacterized protein LOC100749917 isoform X1 [Bombus impatiens]XP_033176926.1 uncharacterized protein LOC100749917 isoform X1 [Bombus impatiens]